MLKEAETEKGVALHVLYMSLVAPGTHLLASGFIIISIITQITCWAPLIIQVQSTGLLSIYLRAHLWVWLIKINTLSPVIHNHLSNMSFQKHLYPSTSAVHSCHFPENKHNTDMFWD